MQSSTKCTTAAVDDVEAQSKRNHLDAERIGPLDDRCRRAIASMITDACHIGARYSHRETDGGKMSGGYPTAGTRRRGDIRRSETDALTIGQIEQMIGQFE